MAGRIVSRASQREEERHECHRPRPPPNLKADEEQHEVSQSAEERVGVDPGDDGPKSELDPSSAFPDGVVTGEERVAGLIAVVAQENERAENERHGRGNEDPDASLLLGLPGQQECRKDAEGDSGARPRQKQETDAQANQPAPNRAMALVRSQRGITRDDQSEIRRLMTQKRGSGQKKERGREQKQRGRRAP